MNWAVMVAVLPREGISDPEGKAVAEAAGQLGFDRIARVRAGKTFVVELEATSAEDARSAASELADRLLANPVIQRAEIVAVRELGR
jgi:phosphoribosylformylglycinamidine synthase PurS subunit